MANPTSIMGASAISWADAAEGGMFQGGDGTVAAGDGDPVGYLPAGAGSAITRYASTARPVLRGSGENAYLEFRDAVLTAGLSRSGSVWIGIRMRAPEDAPLYRSFIQVCTNEATNWMSNSRAGMTFVRSGSNPFYTISFSPTSSWNDVWHSAGGENAWASIQGSVLTNGLLSLSRDGLPPSTEDREDWTNTATTLVVLGGALDNGNPDAASFDIQRYYILDTAPTPEQQAALLNWLNDGDPGGEPEPEGVTGSGAGSAPAQTGTGAGIRIVVGAGAGSVPPQAGAGHGVRHVTGAGAGSAPAQTAEGVGVRTVVGDGSGVSPVQSGAGFGVRQVQGASLGVAPAQGGAGAGVRAILGTGGADAPAQVGAGYGRRIVTGSGMGAAPAQTGAGAGVAAIGSGRGIMPPQIGSGHGVRLVLGTGASVAPAQTGEGRAAIAAEGAGAGIAPAQIGLGYGVRIVIGAGAGAAPAQTGSGGQIVAQPLRVVGISGVVPVRRVSAAVPQHKIKMGMS